MTNKRQKNYFIILALMLMVFCITKVIRGADTLSTSQGGIWNYISLGFYVVFVLACIAQRRFRVELLNTSLFFYTLFSLIAGIAYINALTVNQIYNLLMIPYFSIVFACFYMTAQEDKLSKRIIVFTFVVCLAINMYTIFNYQFLGHQRALASDIYYSLCLFPFILINGLSNKVRNILTGILFFAVFLSGKRAGLVAFVIAFLVYILVDSYVNSKKNLKKVIPITGVGLLLLLGFEIDIRNNLGIFTRLLRMVDDGGSGRIDIYSTVWESFKKSSILEKLFGHGTYKTLDLSGFMAHNDLLEILYDYGIVSAIFIILFYISLVLTAVKMVKRRSKYAPAFCASLIIGFVLSFLSFFFVFYTCVTCMAAFWGYCLALDNRDSLLENDYEA